MEAERIDQLVEEVLAHDRIEKMQDCIARGRRFSPLTLEALGLAWMAAVTAVAFGDDDRLDEWSDLGAEMELRGLGWPDHLMSAEVAAALQRRVAQSTPEHFENVARYVGRAWACLRRQRRH